MINNKYIVIPCMNNKVLLLSMTHVKDLIILDDVCDEPVGVNWDSSVSCGEIPLVVYEVLDEYIYNDNDQISNKLKIYLDKLVDAKKWTETDILDFLNSSTIYYNDGNKRTIYIDFDNDESITMAIAEIYQFEDCDYLEDILLISEIYGYDTLLNLKNISMLELPLLKLEKRIFELYDELV